MAVRTGTGTKGVNSVCMLGEHFADGLNLNIRYSVYSNGYVDTENKWLGKHICKSLKKGAKKTESYIHFALANLVMSNWLTEYEGSCHCKWYCRCVIRRFGGKRNEYCKCHCNTTVQ